MPSTEKSANTVKVDSKAATAAKVTSEAVTDAAKKADVVKKADETKAPVKTAAKAAAKKKAGRPKKDEVKKAAKPAKKATSTERIQEVYIEHHDEQYLGEDIVKKVEDAFSAEGHRASSIKKLQIYINVNEKKAYYVINDKAEGKFVEF